MQKIQRKRLNSVPKAIATRLIVLLILIAFVLIPFGAMATVGVDPCCAIISVGLNTIASLLRGPVASPLVAILQSQNDQTAFQKNVIYPMASINQARSLAGQLLNQLRQARQLYQLPTNSATLPGPQQLERVLLSHNAQSIPQIGQVYVSVYGKVMPSSDARQSLRDQVDMSDAEAQAAMKKAMQLDALADVELQAADQINQQIQTAAPGSAPILEAHAAAWVVRANAYTQSAYAELIRMKAVDLANASGQVKQSAADAANLRGTAGQLLGGGTN